MTQLTPHFALAEFERSGYARRHGIDNRVPPSLKPNLQRLCTQVLEPLREHVGEPIIITSGYRCPAVNLAPEVGGAPSSEHMTGEAADIVSRDRDYDKMHKWMLWIADNLRFHQLIWESDGHTRWIHVSYNHNEQKNTNQVKRLRKKLR